MKLVNTVKYFFIKKEAEKDVLNRKSLFLVTGAVIGIGAALVVIFKSNSDTSSIQQAIEPIRSKSEIVDSKNESTSSKVNSLFNSSSQKNKDVSRRSGSRTVRKNNLNIEYKATQVIKRKGPDGFSKGISIGTNLIGKLLTSIDTRETGQLYKVLLPYGGKGKNGGSIPTNSILFGALSYPGKGRKVFIQFSKILLPDGKEVKLKAQALNSKDYSPGLVGNFHGKRTERIVSTLGLTMVSAMTDTLTEKQALGKGEAVAPKANAKNALYQGLSKVSELEASRQASDLTDQKEYVTVPAGREMIVNLVSTYYGDN